VNCISALDDIETVLGAIAQLSERGFLHDTPCTLLSGMSKGARAGIDHQFAAGEANEAA